MEEDAGGPPSPVAALDVAISPTKAVYIPGDVVTLIATPRDAEGLPVEATVRWSVAPANAATAAGDGTFMLDQEGRLRFEGCVESPAAEHCEAVSILVNAGSPMLTIESPAPGAWLSRADGEAIVVRGVATDRLGEPRVFVNGNVVPLGPDGRFSTEVEPANGINHVEVTATDGLTQNGSTKAFSILWAEGYLSPHPTENRIDVSSALGIRVDQSLLYDGSSAYPSGDTPLANDLTDLVQLVLEDVDATQWIENPVANDEFLGLEILALRLSEKPRIELEFRTNGIELFLAETLFFSMSGEIDPLGQRNFPWPTTTTTDLTGIVRMDLSVYATLSLDDPAHVQVLSSGFSVDQAVGAFQEPTVEATFQLATSLLRQRLGEVIQREVIAPLVDTAAEAITGVLVGVTQGIQSNTFDLETGLGPTAHLTIGGDVSSLAASHTDALTSWVDLFAANAAPPREPPGSGLPEFYLAPQPTFRDNPLGVSVRLSILNALLYATWSGGSLDGTVDDPIEGVTLSATFPPVLVPDASAEYALLLQLGGFVVSIPTSGGEPTQIALDLEAGVDIDVRDGGLAITLATEPRLRAYLLSDTPHPLITPSLVAELLRDQYWSVLTEKLGSALSLDLPVIELSALEPLSTHVARGEVALSGQVIEIRDGYLNLGFDFSVRWP